MMYKFVNVNIKVANFDIYDFNMFEQPDKSVCISGFKIKINNFTYVYKGLRGGTWYPSTGDKLFLGMHMDEIKLYKLDKDIYTNYDMYNDFVSKYGLIKNINEEIGIFIWVVDDIIYFMNGEKQ